jgi:hypothetical protein
LLHKKVPSGRNRPDDETGKRRNPPGSFFLECMDLMLNPLFSEVDKRGEVKKNCVLRKEFSVFL